MAELKRVEAANHELHAVEIAQLKSQMAGLKDLLKEYLGAEDRRLDEPPPLPVPAPPAPAVPAAQPASSSGAGSSGAGSSGAGGSGGDAPWSHEYGSAGPPPAASAELSPVPLTHTAGGEVGSSSILSQAAHMTTPSGGASGGGASGGGAGGGKGGKGGWGALLKGGSVALPQRVAEMHATLASMQEEWETLKSQMAKAENTFADERLAHVAREKSSQWRDETRTARLSKLEAMMSSFAPL